MLMNIRRFGRDPVEVREAISVATTKHHDLVTNSEHITSKDYDVKPACLDFMANNLPSTRNDTKHSSRNKIEDWRKNKTKHEITRARLA